MQRSPIAQIFASEWPLLVAVLRSELGDLDQAEDLAQTAFETATRTWPTEGIPRRPGAWLLTVARRRGIDEGRRRQRFDDRRAALAEVEPGARSGDDPQLAMIFGCCHRSLDRPAQVALTLRYVAGLSTAQIAQSFIVPEATMAKRLVRAKHKIRAARVPFLVPERAGLADSLQSVLAVIYLVFNEGHTASVSDYLVRGDLVDEASWLANHLAELLPDEPEPFGLAALIAFTDARRTSRVDAEGKLVLLQDQDRTRWDQNLIARGHQLMRRAIDFHRPGPYQVQAAIAATHAMAPSTEATDWALIVKLYQQLHELAPSPVVALNAAVAVSMNEGPAAGLDHIDRYGLADSLGDYLYLHATSADLLRQLGRRAEARAAYDRAIALATNSVEQRFLLDRRAGL